MPLLVCVPAENDSLSELCMSVSLMQQHDLLHTKKPFHPLSIKCCIPIFFLSKSHHFMSEGHNMHVRKIVCCHLLFFPHHSVRICKRVQESHTLFMFVLRDGPFEFLGGGAGIFLVRPSFFFFC